MVEERDNALAIEVESLKAALKEMSMLFRHASEHSRLHTKQGSNNLNYKGVR
jgi:hypothetical protein